MFCPSQGCENSHVLCALLSVIIYAAPSQMSIQHCNDEISVRVRCYVVYKRIRIWICRIGSPAGSAVKIRCWQICPYHCLGGPIKKTQPYHSFGPFFAQSGLTPAYRSLKYLVQSAFMHLHCRICEIFHSKWQNMHSGDGPTAQIGNMLHGNLNYGKYRAFNRIWIMH